MKLFIRVEANKITAMGHMMRCMSVAEGAVRKGIEPVFIVATNESAEFPKKRGFKVIVLDRVWDDFDGEIPVMKKLIKEQNIENLLIDSYFVTPKYMEEISRATKTAYIDDLHERIWDAGIIINYAVYCDLFDYRKEYPSAGLLLGTDYFPIRSEYRDASKIKINDSLQRILVVSGGSDEPHFLLSFTKKLLKENAFPELEFTVITGNFNVDFEEISALCENQSRVSVKKSVPTLLTEMVKHDLYISAGGTSLYEMAAVGLPGISYVLADNQYYNAKAFGDKGLGMFAGDVREEGTIEKIFDCIEKYKDKGIRSEMSARLYGLLDKKGADRIAEEICYYQ